MALVRRRSAQARERRAPQQELVRIAAGTGSTQLKAGEQERHSRCEAVQNVSLTSSASRSLQYFHTRLVAPHCKGAPGGLLDAVHLQFKWPPATAIGGTARLTSAAQCRGCDTAYLREFARDLRSPRGSWCSDHRKRGPCVGHCHSRNGDRRRQPCVRCSIPAKDQPRQVESRSC